MADQTRPHRVEVNVFDLFVVFLDAAQGAVEEPGLPEFAVGWRELGPAATVSAFLAVGFSHTPLPTARLGLSVLSFLHIGAEQSVDAGLIAWPLPSIPFHHIAVDP